MIEPVEIALRDQLARRADNPWGLVFPTADGQPASDKDDREEWYAIQYTASVEDVPAGEYAGPLDRPRIHPSGKRFYYVHQCRNFAATELDEVGASDNVAMSLIGHSSERMLRRYQKANHEPKSAAVTAIGERLQLAGRPRAD